MGGVSSGGFQTFHLRPWWWLLCLALAVLVIISGSPANSMPVDNNGELSRTTAGRRLLNMVTADYDYPSANHKNDPPSTTTNKG